MPSDRLMLDAETRASEGARLRELVDELAQGRKGEFAVVAGIGTPAYLTQLMTGHRPLNLEVAVKVAKGLKVPIDRFSPRLAALAREAASCVSDTLYTMQAPRTLSAQEPSKPAAPSNWPLAVISYEDFAALPRDVLDRLEGAILVLRPPKGNGKARRA